MELAKRTSSMFLNWNISDDQKLAIQKQTRTGKVEIKENEKTRKKFKTKNWIKSSNKKKNLFGRKKVVSVF